MPPAPRISNDIAIDTLMKYKIHFQSEESPPYSHEVWKRLEKEQNEKWSSHNWYNKLKGNIGNLRTGLRNALNVEAISNESLHNTLDSSVEDNNNTIFITDRGDKEEECWLNGYLQQKEWTAFNILTMDNLSEEIRCKIPPDVLDKIVEPAFWKQNRLPCVFGFIGGEIDTTARTFFKVLGYCKSNKCENEFYGHADTKPRSNNDELHIHVRTLKTSKIHHENMHPVLDRDRKRRFEEEVIKLDYVKSIITRPRRAHPPPPSTAVTPKNNEVTPEEKSLGQDPIRNIYKMHFFGSIHDLSYSPFYVHFGLTAQTVIWKTYSGSTRTSTISICGTSNCCEKIVRPRGLPPARVSLYAIAVRLDSTIFPVYQMLSENPEPEVLEFWIKRWMRRMVSKPKQVISPYVENILSACAEDFNNSTFERYIENIFQTLMTNHGLPRNLTIIRIDPGELAEIIREWSCLQSVDSHDVRQFYIKSLAVLATCRTLEEFKEIFSLISIVASQNYIDSALQFEVALTAHDAKQKLQNSFSKRDSYMNSYWEVIDSGNHMRDPYTFVDKPVFVSHVEVFFGRLTEKLRTGNDVLETDTSFYDPQSSVIGVFIQNLITSAVSTSRRGTQLNPYFLPAIIIELFRLGKHFPLWTAVALPNTFLNQSKSHARIYVESSTKKLFDSHKHSTQVDGSLKHHLQDVSANESSLCRFETSPPMSFCSSKSLREPHLSDNQGQDLPCDPVIETSFMNPLVTKVELGSRDTFDSVLSKYSGNARQSPVELDSCGISSLHQQEKMSSETNEGTCSGENVDENLREKETFNLVYSQRSQSKFFRDLPAAGLINQLQSRAKDVFFLRNGNVSPAVVLDGRKFEVKNTCAFDSISRILITSALDFLHYRSFILKSHDQMMEFVKLFLSNAPRTEIWAKRVHILSPNYVGTETKTNNRVILTTFDAWDNLTQVWKHSVISEPSAITVLECEKCGDQFNPRSSLAPNHFTIGRLGYKALENALDFNSLLFNVFCQKCKVGAMGRTIPNQHLFLELDVRIGRNNLITKKGKIFEFPPEITFDMKEIGSNERIIISKQTYRLAGVIDLTGGHYTAYCRRLSGLWELYNDIHYKTDPCTGKESITPHSAIYILKIPDNVD